MLPVATFIQVNCQLLIMPALTEPAKDEKELVNSVLRGGVDAFKELIGRYEKLVASIVFRMIDGEQDREDLCQDIFLLVYEKLSTFRFQSKLSTWIGNIAFNRCINFLKKKKHSFLNDIYKDEISEYEGKTIIAAPEAMQPTVDEVLIKKHILAALEKSIEQLPPMQKTVLPLFHYEELSLDEVAVITNLPVNTVKSHLFRARKNLKNQLLHF